MELTVMERQEIEKQVSTLLETDGYNFERDSDVDVVSMSRGLGFLVGNADLSDDEDGFLMIQPKSDTTSEGLRVIGVNAKRSLEYKRFVIAHELGHSILHYKEGRIYLHREKRKGKDADENDADYFAAALLMPRASFSRIYRQLQEKGSNRNAICLQLASIFKVPQESVVRRIEEVIENPA